jgi:hypothetical protein
MRDLLRSGQWQVMTAEEQERIKRQMTQGHLSTAALDYGCGSRARLRGLLRRWRCHRR